MNAKRNVFGLIFILIILIFTGCAGMHIGGGAAYIQGGGDAAVYQSINRELVVLPKTDPGIGWCVEIGKTDRDATGQVSFTSASLKGKYGTTEYDCGYGKIGAGMRFFLGEEEDIRFTLPVNISYHWLNVPGAGLAGTEKTDVFFTGLGAEGGLGIYMKAGDNFFITADALWAFDLIGNAASKNSSGKLEESVLSSGPAFRAGAYFVME